MLFKMKKFQVRQRIHQYWYMCDAPVLADNLNTIIDL